MNELYYLKEFFRAIYDNRIYPIILFFKYSLIERMRLLFMNQEQRERYFERQQEKHTKAIENIMQNMAGMAVSTAVIGAGTAAIFSKPKKKSKKSCKKND